MQLALEGCCNLQYNASPADCVSQGRRPAYLFELLCRAADATEFGSWGAVRGAVAGSRHVAKLLAMWASAQVRRCL